MFVIDIAKPGMFRMLQFDLQNSIFNFCFDILAIPVAHFHSRFRTAVAKQRHIAQITFHINSCDIGKRFFIDLKIPVAVSHAVLIMNFILIVLMMPVLITLAHSHPMIADADADSIFQLIHVNPQVLRGQ